MDDRELNLVSVVIPAFNAASTIGEQLGALLDQTYQGDYEIVVVDNGSADTTAEVVNRFATDQRIRLVLAADKQGPSHARNAGIRASRGELVLMCDADDLVDRAWIREMVAAAHSADIVTGCLEDDLLNDGRVRAWRRTAPRTDGLTRPLEFLPFAPSGNIGVWRDVFEVAGWWREDMQCGEDIEWSWRAQLAGFNLAYAASATVHYRHRPNLRSLARQFHCYGLAQAMLYGEYRDRGARRRTGRAAFNQWLWLLLHLGDLGQSEQRRGRWVRVAARNAGRLHGSIRVRVFFP